MLNLLSEKNYFYSFFFKLNVLVIHIVLKKKKNLFLRVIK